MNIAVAFHLRFRTFAAHNLFEGLKPTFSYYRTVGDDKGALHIQFTHKLHGTDGLAETHLGIPEELAIFRKNFILVFTASSTSFTETLLRLVDCVPLLRSKSDKVIGKQVILHAGLYFFKG